MQLCKKKGNWATASRTFVACMVIACSLGFEVPMRATARPQAAANTAHPVGTVKAISGKTITVTTDAGPEVTIQVQEDARLLRVTPGEKDLKNATPLQLADLQVGDRILVRGKLADDGKTVLASSVIAVKQADVAARQAHEREEWQRHGVGGLVTKIDPASGTITLATNALGAAKDVVVQVSKQTILRRYAPNSVKFDDAKPAPIDQIKTGDQLRARGTRSADNAELTADEVVSGTFRNIAGTINSIDTSAQTITVTDLVTKKPVIVKISKDTQLRKLAPQMAQMIAMRLKSAGSESGGPSGSANGTPRAAEGAPSSPAGGAAGGNARSGGRGGDLQQALSRMPASTLADLQKGDAVMIVTTEGSTTEEATAITLLAGVEPILEASPKGAASSILTPWTMSGAPSGDAAQ